MKAEITEIKPAKPAKKQEAAQELSLPERAQIALSSSETEHKLVELSSAYKSITAITNKDGREECHSALMVVRNARTAIERTSKAAREDAVKFSKAIIAEENRLIGIISAEEKRLADLRDAWDKQKEIERKAAEEAERQRITAIREKIIEIRNVPVSWARHSVDQLRLEMETFEAAVLDPDYYGDLLLEAKIAHKETVAILADILDRKINEAEQEKIREAERIALEEQRAEQARIAAEQAAAQKAIDDAQAAIKAQKDAIDAANAEIAAKQLKLQKEVDKRLERIIPEHIAIGSSKEPTATEISDRQIAAVSTMTAEQIEAKVYLPTNPELYSFLLKCTVEHYGLTASEAKDLIITMIKAMKV